METKNEIKKILKATAVAIAVSTVVVYYLFNYKMGKMPNMTVLQSMLFSTFVWSFLPIGYGLYKLWPTETEIIEEINTLN